MRTEMEYEDMKMDEIAEDDWWEYDDEDDYEGFGIWTMSAAIEAGWVSFEGDADED